MKTGDDCGEVVLRPATSLFIPPRHPYTRAEHRTYDLCRQNCRHLIALAVTWAPGLGTSQPLIPSGNPECENPRPYVKKRETRIGVHKVHCTFNIVHWVSLLCVRVRDNVSRFAHSAVRKNAQQRRCVPDRALFHAGLRFYTPMRPVWRALFVSKHSIVRERT